MVMDRRWARFQQRLGYSDAEMKAFRSNPKWVKMVEEATGFARYKIVAEVVQSHGCMAQHKVGDRIVMDANGLLMKEECPDRMCVNAVAPLACTFSAVCERLADNLDPRGICFTRVGCTDVGPECGGWGRVIMQIRVEPIERK